MEYGLSHKNFTFIFVRATLYLMCISYYGDLFVPDALLNLHITVGIFCLPYIKKNLEIIRINCVFH